MTLFRLLLACAALVPAAAYADLAVFACEPEWAALANELGHEHVDAYSATSALQDPHYVQARPSLIAKVRKADLLVCSGAQLEIGWLPVLLQKANNRQVLPGTAGYFEASSLVHRLDEAANVDRALGDIHPQGNPHVQTDPHNIALIATALAQRMGELDSTNAAVYDTNLGLFLQRWQEAIKQWESRAASLRGKRVITHHKSWVYLERWLGLVEVANLEAVPGVPPSAAHLGQLVKQFSDGGANLIIRSPYQDARAAAWLSKRTGIPAIVVPLTVGGTDAASDLFTLFDDIVNRLLGAAG